MGRSQLVVVDQSKEERSGLVKTTTTNKRLDSSI